MRDSALNSARLGEQIVAVARESAQFKRAALWYGGAVTSPSGGTSTSADIAGDGLSAAAALLPHAEVTGMALEVGVIAMLDVLNALRVDTWLHAHGDLSSPQGRAIKKASARHVLRRCGRLEWYGRGQSQLATRRALAGLRM